MSDVKNKAVSSVKSGNVNTAYADKVLGGYPAKKSVEAIEKVNTPGKAPGSTRD